MHGLKGDFDTMPLRDLVGHLVQRKLGGRLALHHAGVEKFLWLEDGRVIHASSNQPREYLGQLLLNLGHLSEEGFLRAYQAQREKKDLLGRILVQSGAVPEPVVQRALELKFRETLLDAFRWDSGSFELLRDERPPGSSVTETAIGLEDVLREGEFRETAWRSIRAVFPHGDLQLMVRAENVPEPPAPLDKRILVLAQEGQTIDEMALSLRATDFLLYQRLYALHRLSALEVAPPGKRPPGGPSKESDDFEDTDLAAALSAQRRIPRLTGDPDELRNHELSAPERYLLSRVDGVRDLRTLARVSPLQEAEVLRLFRKLVQLGLVTLEPVSDA